MEDHLTYVSEQLGLQKTVCYIYALSSIHQMTAKSLLVDCFVSHLNYLYLSARVQQDVLLNRDNSEKPYALFP